ncbi:FKBP-type peptidyl-prolyl cis-trans isomerase [Thalassotalea euphylliae]|uniref:Peptidyl-prolyl cis-trans isomerase n=1 Tax=Thalassotalea euphylliae TaxID=1655234 RepID=A0A3E0TVQ9_9GAMM|nr:FKBP-type peptidyl-prolyl cis-trans isomerase [Thalassotalea euphylliae]REL28443.1 FKBP-type peptidyl-prolyl cis-trans isomerase [Thalassotalea euphylliae]
MKLFKPTLVAIAMVSVFGCQEAKKEDPVAAQAPVLEAEIDKQAYGLGASIGMYMERNLAEHEKLGLALDKELIVKGFVESLEGKSQLPQEEIQALLMSLDQQMKEKQQAQIAKQAEDALAEGQKYLEENAKREGVMTTESGIQYEIITPAEGEKPTATDTVKVHYTGTLINGDKFDSSVDRGQPAVFPLNRVIRGWTEGVQLMSVGAKYKFTIPSDLAYGPMGNPPRIPGNSVLNFEIELLEIQKPEPAPEVGEQAEAVTQ